MKKILITLAILGAVALGLALAPKAASAQSTVFQGGTGLNNVGAGNILIGSIPTVRMATSSGLTFSTSTLTLNATRATTTQFTNSGSTWLTSITSALMLTDANGLVAEYAGSSCTNQFVRSLSALGAATCASVATTDITDDTILEVDLDATNAPSDNQILSFDNATGGFTWVDDEVGSAAAFPFTPASYNGQAVNATSTGLWLTGSPLSMVASTTFATNASSTQFTNSGSTWLTSITAALILTDANGLVAEYAGTSCTNQFVRSLSVLGAATCASVGSADVTDGALTADDLGADSVSSSELNATGVESELEAVLDGEDLQSACTDDEVLGGDGAGGLECQADQQGAGGGSWPFTPSTYGSQAVQATSTGLWLTGSPLSLVASTTFATNASSTQLTNSGSTWLTSMTSALLLTGADGLVAEYAGTSCTNQFTRSLSALGVATCESVVSADVTDGTLTADDLGADSVSASELNATGVETELETELDIGGEVTSTGLSSTVIGDSISVSTWNLTTPTFTTSFIFDGVTVAGLSGVDTSVLTGTAGTNGNCAEWNADGDLVDAGDPCGTGAGGSWPFTPSTYGSQAVQATSTGLWLTGTPLSLIASTTFATNASSTQLTNSGATWLTSMTSALLLTGADGLVAEYAGTSCTNQFVRSLSALGAATCATVDLAADITGTLPVENGGTEATSLTDHGVLVGSGTGAITPLAVGTNGQLLVGSTGADPVFATLNCADGLTCTTGAGTLEIDFDGTDSPQGELGGTWASPTIDDSLAVTNWNLTTPTLTGTTTLNGQLVIRADSGNPYALDVRGTTYPVFRSVRSLSTTNTTHTAFSIVASTSATMADNFGVDFDFILRDDSFVDNPVALIRARRSGADNSGILSFTTYNAGVQTERMHILPSGRVGISSSTPMSLLGVAGTTTTQTLNIMNPSHTGTSTQYIYSGTAGFGGEIILEDSDGAGCTSITTLNGTVSGITVTCPADPTDG